MSVADFAVPPVPMRGRARDARLGLDEGELCLRSYQGEAPCLGRIEYLPDASLGGCQCPHSHPPCGYCVSTAPECSGCGWRADG